MSSPKASGPGPAPKASGPGPSARAAPGAGLQNVNVAAAERLPPPDAIRRELPMTERAEATVAAARETLVAILERRDPRLFVVVGPCSIHDVRAAREYADRLLMSTVNYAEALILIQDRQPHLFAELRDALQSSSIRLVAPTPEHAETAAAARLRYPLNLGDCFAYALARHEDVPLLTLDRDFRRTGLKLVLPGTS